MNVQVIAAPAGRLVWASQALPGSAHDLTAARTHDIIDALTSANVMTFADKAYQGCSPCRTTSMVKAILVLHHIESPVY